MIKEFLKSLEGRPPIQSPLAQFSRLFARDSGGHPVFSDKGFETLVNFLGRGETSYQNVAVQAAMRWSTGTQKVLLRNTILERGFLTPSCLWAHKNLRGSPDQLFQEYRSPEMAFMQILLLKDSDPARAVPFLIDRFLNRDDVPDGLAAASRLCVRALMDAGISPELLNLLRSRYGSVDVIKQWRPTIPVKSFLTNVSDPLATTDFHQMIRSVRDMKELSSLTRTVYVLSLFYVPLAEKEWRSLWLSSADQLFFSRLRAVGIVEAFNGGFLLSSDAARQAVVKKFLFDSYAPARESVRRNRAERLKEDRERRVRNSELDRHALGMVPDGIICVDRKGTLYYMNPAAESLLETNEELRERLFGRGPLENALAAYSKEALLSRIVASNTSDGHPLEVFGNRIAIDSDGKRFEVELGPQVILIRDTTDRYLIDQEVGKLYRHELKAELDVMAVGLDTARELLAQDSAADAMQCLTQVEAKRRELCALLEERIDFIRLHSDAFQILPVAVNLNLVADRCIGNYREAAGGKDICIESDHLEAAAISVSGEERFLARALDNIIRNAVKFSENGGKIKVLLGIENGQAFVRVMDNGPGIAPENMEKIFQLGFTTGGSGRGLYIAKRIASAHGGRIDVTSSLGGGACFTLRIPLVARTRDE